MSPHPLGWASKREWDKLLPARLWEPRHRDLGEVHLAGPGEETQEDFTRGALAPVGFTLPSNQPVSPMILAGANHQRKINCRRPGN